MYRLNAVLVLLCPKIYSLQSSTTDSAKESAKSRSSSSKGMSKANSGEKTSKGSASRTKMDEDKVSESDSDSEDLFAISRAKAALDASNSDGEGDSDGEEAYGSDGGEGEDDIDAPNNFVVDRVVKVDGVDLPYEKLNKIAGETLIKVGKGNVVKTYVDSFSQLGVSDWLLENIESKLKWTIPTHVQQMAIPALLSGRDLQVASPTGSGKTAAFLVPILQLLILQKDSESTAKPKSPSSKPSKSKKAQNEEKEENAKLPTIYPLNLVVAPTIELAKQIYHQALLLCDSPSAEGVSVELLNKSLITKRQEHLASSSSSSSSTTENSSKSSSKSSKSSEKTKSKNHDDEEDGDRRVRNFDSDTIDLVITTPSRLAQLLESKAVSLSRVHHLVLDEVDRLMTDEMLNQADAIISSSKDSPSRRIAFFSATIMPSVESLAATILQTPVRARIGMKNTAADHVDQHLLYTGSEEGKLMAVNKLLTGGKVRAPVLIFMQSKNRTSQLIEGFGSTPGFTIDYITGDRTEGQRRNALLKFRSGETTVLITTDLLARGLDFRAVATVINYDMPTSATTYIHRIGRTGRVGGVTGEAWTLFTDADIQHISPIANVMVRSGQEDNIPPWVLLQASKKNSSSRGGAGASRTSVVHREDVGGGFGTGISSPSHKGKKQKYLNPSRQYEEVQEKKKSQKDEKRKSSERSHKRDRSGSKSHDSSSSKSRKSFDSDRSAPSSSPNKKKRSRNDSETSAATDKHAPPKKIKKSKM